MVQNRYFFYLLLLILISTKVLGKNTIFIKDTLIPVGNIYEIPVYGNLENLPQGNLKLKISFNSLNLDIKGASGSNELGFENSQLVTITSFNQWYNSEIVISTNKYKLNYSGILFYLTIESLVGPDSITMLRPISLEIDGAVIDCEFQSAKITTRSPIVEQKFIENISLFYPNPFNYEATVKFTIEEDTKVEFLIYNYSGTKVFEIPSNSNEIKFIIFNEKDEKIAIENPLVLKKGTYKIIIAPVLTKFSSGLYYFIMKTKKGYYGTNFIYVK